jgi:hypothetical protein
LDTGTLHITSSRLLFDGSKKSTTIPYRKIINFTLYSDGIKVEKETGKDQVFQWAGDSEVLGTVLQSALKRA